MCIGKSLSLQLLTRLFWFDCHILLEYEHSNRQETDVIIIRAHEEFAIRFDKDISL